MRKMPQVSSGIAAAEKKWTLPLLASFLVTLILLLAGTLGFRGHSEAFYRIFSLGRPVSESGSTVLSKDPDSPPVLGYLISGTRGDGERMKRLLSAVYHPRNQYLLHLDSHAPDGERVKLALYANSDRVFRVMNNVNVIGKADTVTYMGSTAIASTLHAAAILLRINTNWDWLITLSALDYPLITQDELECRRGAKFSNHAESSMQVHTGQIRTVTWTDPYSHTEQVFKVVRTTCTTGSKQQAVSQFLAGSFPQFASCTVIFATGS